MFVHHPHGGHAHTARTNSDTVWFTINARIKWHKGAAGGKDLKVVFFPNHDVDPCCEGQRKFFDKVELGLELNFFLYQGNFSPLLCTSLNKNVADDKTDLKKKNQCLPLSLFLQSLYDFFLDIVQRVKVLYV